ncbi:MULTISPECIES: hypothetical protein [unclassified Pseudoalteromonas]|uniref:hypothetical protein n=1 Tax=unclassified Pseudoalteromonas TaxID=194690 RepID=UPI00048C4779|nr:MULTISPECIES: hypothetical protein [unclassified Pseudoalteromonas]
MTNNKGYFVRTSKPLESKILALADQMGMSMPETFRYLAEQALNAKSYEQLLHDTEVRILRKTFEICSATVGLSSSEKEKAKRACNDSFMQEVL